MSQVNQGVTNTLECLGQQHMHLQMMESYNQEQRNVFFLDILLE